MNELNVVRQTQIEKSMLEVLIEGLRDTLAWKISGNDLSRKLSTMRFITRSFQNHMRRLMDIEERDGYMDIVLERHPHLSKSVDALRREHDEFRRVMSELLHLLETVIATDQNSLNTICDKTCALLKKVDMHNQKERDIFQEAFEREEGGEG